MEIPRHWRLKDERYKMLGNQCENCFAPAFPPTLICADCGKPMHIEIKNDNSKPLADVAPVSELSSPIEVVLDQSVRITSPNGIPDAAREAKPYSRMVEREVLGGLIYEAT